MLTLAEVLQIAAGLIILACIKSIPTRPVEENEPDINTYLPNCFNN